MSKEKQIEEMAKILASDCGKCPKCEHFHKEVNGIDSCYFKYADMVYNAGFRKQSEGEWMEVADYGVSKVVKCSCCENEFYFMKKGQLNIDKMPHCPKCGAKMKGAGNEKKNC